MSNTQAVYNYDKLGRLTNVTFSNGAMATYSYDTAGNRTSLVEVPATLSPPPPAPSISGFSKRIAGDFKNTPMMVLLSDGTLSGWGDNDTGALSNGLNTATNSLRQSVLFDPNTTIPPSTESIVDWVFTNTNLYVVYSNGWVYSAGTNTYGQLGHGDTTDRLFLKRIEYFITNSITVKKVWATCVFTTTNTGGCALFQDSNFVVYGCGLNTTGNLGVNGTTNLTSPLPCGLPAGTTGHVTDVAMASASTNVSAYLLMNDGSLLVAGYNLQGQLGVNSVTNVTGGFVKAYNSSLVPVSNAVSISANAGYSAAGNALIVDTSGNVWTTGYNAHGELGLGNTTNAKVFTPVAALSGITKAELGGGTYGFGYALNASNTLYTWGYNGQNNLFKNNSTTPQSTPSAASSPPAGVISKVFFSKGSAGLTTTPQMIVLTTAGHLAYAGADIGQLPVAAPSGAYNFLPMPKPLLDGTDTVVDVFVHGTGLTQRWFVLTANGNLYGCGSNADAICCGGIASTVLAANVAWHPISFA
ncbi:MAG: hypothetical protein JST01_26215 [Cyanobacteria bacterium SZAS TMP-1]|nr:hypothetical protein [Cyanobacteria bacterium SZAS TMP-1]